jgi:hypothetical protein
MTAQRSPSQQHVPACANVNKGIRRFAASILVVFERIEAAGEVIGDD